MTDTFDALVVGAGAAGLFCAAEIGKTGKTVCVIDHSAKPAEKVRISGGGRCNFTNVHTEAGAFLSENPHFGKSALSRYTPGDFCDLMQRHGLTWHEKTLGQLFCDQKSTAVIKLLLDELEAAGGQLRLSTEVANVRHVDGRFALDTSDGTLTSRHLVVATGGLSIPKIGATGFAYDLARRFGHDVITPRPGLVPFTFSGDVKQRFADLSGVSVRASARAGTATFEENILFTHRGLSGPAILQVSSYWQAGDAVTLNLIPSLQGGDTLLAQKQTAPKRTLGALLAETLPKRLVDALGDMLDLPLPLRLGDLPNATLTDMAEQLRAWPVKPAGTEGWRTAEVTVAGVSTQGLSSKTMESRHLPGLYFIGECVDVTGWLGGYNFQWAWASAHAAGQAIGSNG